MAASLAKGSSLIQNAAIEPEIVNLCEFLNKMGARIEGIGTSILNIEGVEELSSADLDIINDRIEAGTILIAGALTKSKIEIELNNSEHLDAVIMKLEDSGVKVLRNNNIVSVDASNIDIKSIDISPGIYPGFPTDVQAQWTAYMTMSGGTVTVTDNIYLDRFKHVPELNRLGADIEIIGNSAVIKGVDKLKGAKVMSTDLRASASLVLAGLAAEGITEVLRIYHLDRGYERIEEKLKLLGADIERVSTTEY